MRRRRFDPLVFASGAFVAANVLHTLDHQRQGTERLTWEVFAGGAAISVLGLAVLFMALRRDPRAPVACAIVGLSSAAGVAASHLAPHWSAFSDPYSGLGLDALSWAIMLAEVVAALALGVAGIRGATSLATSSSWRASSPSGHR
jgi:ABC-type branched-subunit amino acid transport system permease subunit